MAPLIEIPPPLLGRQFGESVIRFIVWSSLIGSIAAPLVLFTAVYLNLFGGSLASPEGNTFARTIGTVVGQTPAPPTPKIITNVLAQERAKQIERLTALTGRAEMASGAVSSVHLIAVAFEGVKPDDADTQVFPRQSVYEDGYRRLTLDVSQAPRDAVVMVSDQPIRWTTLGLQPGSWLRLAFEGIAAFDIVDGQKGSLAGFRIAAFGATNVMCATDPTKGEVSIPQTFCASVRTWTDHFAVAFDQVRFTLLLNPTRVTPRQGVVATDGEIAKSLFGDDIERLCKRRSAYQ